MSIFKTAPSFFYLFCLVICTKQRFPNLPATITITGKAYDVQDPKLPLPKLMVINKRTNQGVFADAEGKFSLAAFKTDTLLFSSLGFMVKKICLKDSTDKKVYYVEVGLKKLEFTLKEVSVFANRNLNEIQKDIDKLGVKRTIRPLEQPMLYLVQSLFYTSDLASLPAPSKKLLNGRTKI
ncbi:MAG: hypothetical protein IPH89_12645 [Bacteroidetes bacterium]|nr:hypothetical protein [Bacteroidota bacterium]